ncbi:MAG: LolA family protein [Chitinophagaceae bacterium]
MRKRLTGIILLSVMLSGIVNAQDIRPLLQKVKDKYDRVADYTADGRMKTNVLFIKAPVAQVKVYYKKPDRLRIRNERGVSFIPKGTVNINMNNVLGLNNYEAMAAGVEKVAGRDCRVVKIFPLSDEENITRATLYIDEARLLVIRSVISTRENGTYELVMHYTNYAEYGLPDRVELTFNTKDYKLPKGISIDYDNGAGKSDRGGPRKGKVEITYTGYVINKGVPDSVFQ